MCNTVNNRINKTTNWLVDLWLFDYRERNVQYKYHNILIGDNRGIHKSSNVKVNSLHCSSSYFLEVISSYMAGSNTGKVTFTAKISLHFFLSFQLENKKYWNWFGENRETVLTILLKTARSTKRLWQNESAQ